ncbi:MAG: phosphodiesterase [Eubacteriales bacterium]|nr:phosphodiesterase [Eubacteriales bacterium]
MKYIFASDIHGSAFYCRKLIERFKESGAKKLILLGDILYHGPRNDLPKEYAPKEVMTMLNEIKEDIICVRGNCEAEVDQMVLEFPCMADYAVLNINDLDIFATHGHLFNTDNGGRNLPPIKNGDILIHGHTHLPVAEKFVSEDGEKSIYWLNPGSVSLPKENNPNSYALLDNELFTIYDFDGNIVKEIKLRG